MDTFQDYFICDECENRDFKIVCNFSLRFHGVNFSDELIYDKLINEMYQCTNCKKTFSKKEIEDALAIIKIKHKKK